MKNLIIILIFSGIAFSIMGQDQPIYIPFRIDNKWCLADQSGEKLFEPKFEQTYPAKASRIRFRKGKKFGFINSKGEVIIKPIYSEASDFFPYGKTEINQVTFKGSTYYIDKNGNPIEPVAGCGQGRMNRSNLMRTFEVDGKFGVLDLVGDTLIPPKFNKIMNYQDGEFVIAQDFNLKQGIIGSTGDTLYQFSLDSVVYNSNRGYYKIYESGLVGIIDIQGNIQAFPIYENLSLYGIYSIYGTLIFYTENENEIIGYIHNGIEFWE